MILTEFEKRAISIILKTEAPQLMGQLDKLKVGKRVETGVGVFVFFQSRTDSNVKTEKYVLGARLQAARKDYADTLKFQLYVEDGQISAFEVFSNWLDDFPKNLDGFTLFYSD
jgi:hypothetical protein